MRISTTDLAEEIGGSQQSASRHLKVLEEMRLIIRDVGSGVGKVQLTNKGIGELENILSDLEWHLKGKEAEPITIEGVVVSGLFEGAYYISKEGYKRQIIEGLGFEPFPGTLNIRINHENMEKRRQVVRSHGVFLKGFVEEDRAYGSAWCYHVIIEGEVEGALIEAERSIHDTNIMEIIAPVYLRRELDLADGDHVSLVFVPLRQSGA